MGIGIKLIVITVLAAIAAFVYELTVCDKPKIPHRFFEDAYWGSKVLKEGEPIPKDSAEIRKFVVKIEDSVLQDLKQRLQTTRFVEPLPGTQFTYGFNGDELKKIVNYWLKTYDWRIQETELNKYNHFKTQIEGIDIHFIHAKPPKAAKHTIPLLLVHGWPTSIVQYLKFIPLLTAVENDTAFELIIPSIPGFGFSEAPHRPQFAPVNAARVFKKLMDKLKHRQYYIHGDHGIGSMIGQNMAAMYPENVLGYHTTMATLVEPTPRILIKFALAYFIPTLFSDNPQEEIERLKPFSYIIRETGNMHMHATKPDTLSVSLLNSPAGLAAYILDWFVTLTNDDNRNLFDGGLTKHFTYDDLLTNVMLYWNTIHRSLLVFRDNVDIVHSTSFKIDEFPYISEKVPVGLTIPKNDIFYTPKLIAKQAFKNLLHYNFLSRGGHFIALEEPELLSNEIRTFIAKCVDWHVQRRNQESEKISKSK